MTLTIGEGDESKFKNRFIRNDSIISNEKLGSGTGYSYFSSQA